MHEIDVFCFINSPPNSIFHSKILTLPVSYTFRRHQTKVLISLDIISSAQRLGYGGSKSRHFNRKACVTYVPPTPSQPNQNYRFQWRSVAILNDFQQCPTSSKRDASHIPLTTVESLSLSCRTSCPNRRYFVILIKENKRW